VPAAADTPQLAAAEASLTDEQRELARQAKAAKRKKRKAAKGWKEATVNTSVYITGLPQEVTPGSLQAHFAHCGALKRDLENKPKLKIYMDEEGKPKGDARMTFARPESMPLAKLLDESWFDPRHQIRVAEAAFKPKEDFVAPESKYSAQELAKRKKQLQARAKELLQGTDEETRRHVILKNVFSLNDVPSSTDASMQFFKELKEDFLQECGKFGDVESIKVFERNPLGVVALKLRTPPAAVRCLEVLDGRFFGGRKLAAEWYDGYSNYNVQESEAEQKRRIDDFGKWLEGDGK
jgi:HIV Tat-specific factor 1